MWIFQIMLPPAWKIAVKQVAKADGDSIKAYIRNLVKEDLKKRGLL